MYIIPKMSFLFGLCLFLTIASLNAAPTRRSIDEILKDAKDRSNTPPRRSIDEILKDARDRSNTPPRRSIDQILKGAENRFRSSHPSSTRVTHDGGDRTEIDIIVKKGEINAHHTARNAIKDANKRWPKGVINYYINPSAFGSSDVAALKKAMNEWESETCLTFKDVGTQNVDKIQFVKEDGCWSWVGREGGAQKVSIGSGCMHHEVIIHEIGHAIGFHHEQTRADRDDNVTILKANIRSDMLHNFKKYDTSYLSDFGVPYDYRSCMHYGSTAFSKNGQITIKTKDPAFQNVIGDYAKVSFRDVKLVNAMYNCPQKCDKSKSCPGEGFLDKNCQCKCPGTPTVTCGGGPGPTKAPSTKPPATQPPATKPPTTQSPATQPPATQSTATQPPGTTPPGTQETATQETTTTPFQSTSYY